ncbi:MAG TPA: hypothetical protein VFR35_19910 [Actinoplanes sp.]|nr:hypothetical protein [Actinoplanes sp.]
MAKYLLIQHYEGGAGGDTPMGDWDPADVRAHIDFQVALDADLSAAGELVDSQGVAFEAVIVTSDGTTTSQGAPDGKLLAGYRVVDVATRQRALEIAARTSAAPGAKGVPIQQPIEVRRVMQAP